MERGIVLSRSMVVALIAAVTVALDAMPFMMPPVADAASDERTISIYEIHTKETTTVTYKRNGKYIPSAMKKINWALRDWRRNKPIKMDPKLIDTIWEMHKELGSKLPIHVVSGYRSRKTNNRLRRRRGGQAKFSQHILGKAVDIRFPDISAKKLRASAMVRERGGVGYYPTSAIPFVHVDTGRVRAWPRMNRRQLAMLFPYGPTKHIPSDGRPLTNKDRYRARIRIAALNAKKARTRLALATAKSQPKSLPLPLGAPKLTLASLGANSFKLPGRKASSGHWNRLWVNKEPSRYAALMPMNYRLTKTGPVTTASLPAKAPRKTKMPAPRKIVAATPSLQTASLASNADILKKKTVPPLKVAKTGLKTDSGTTTQIESTQTKSASKALRLATMAQSEPTESFARAPRYNIEHPEELAYRPFSITPLIADKPVSANLLVAAMVAPRYDQVGQLMDVRYYNAVPAKAPRKTKMPAPRKIVAATPSLQTASLASNADILKKKTVPPLKVAKTGLKTDSGTTTQIESTQTKSASKALRLATMAQSEPTESFARAPRYNIEHPEELAYRPFSITPLIADKPVSANLLVAAMVAPRYDQVGQLMGDAEKILPMQFRPSPAAAELMWSQQFRGKAVRNVFQRRAALEAMGFDKQHAQTPVHILKVAMR